MSGISGMWSGSTVGDDDSLRRHGHRMVMALRHRGHNACVATVASQAVMLAASGEAPGIGARLGVSPDGRYLVALAGQVHTPPLFRLQGVTTGDHTASELAQRIQALGLQRTLECMDGGFCIAVLDRRLQTLSLARDRMGRTSLYYGWTTQGFAFASELKAIASLPDFGNQVDRNTLTLLLRFGYIPAPFCIYQGIFKLAAGAVQVFGLADVERGAAGHVPNEHVRYWDAKRTVEALITQRPASGETLAIAGLQHALDGAVERSATNTAGAFLSGGTDSSLIAALLQSQRATPVDTLTIGFEDADHDEMDWARKVADYLGTRHTAHRISDQQALGLLPGAADTFCEPFADSSQIPMLLAAGYARTRMTHGLTGDGGDELFFGHAAYARAIRNGRLTALFPECLRGRLQRQGTYACESARLGGWRAVLGETASRSVEDSYLLRVSRWRHPAAVLRGASEYPTLYDTPTDQLSVGAPDERVLFLDVAMELREGLMTKVDRACMAHGLTPASPFLDADVFRLAWQLPLELKTAGGEQKYILKRLLERYLPRELIYRPKRGFGAPVGRWLQGSLRDWAEALLVPTQLEQHGIFDPAIVRQMWSAFIGGQRKWHTHLWPILMYQAWQQRWCVPSLTDLDAPCATGQTSYLSIAALP
ncbi:asparagine synthase C-terminal domain-containing protein [Xanthomonas vesicatoria]|uniref:asparagine synthetase B family protein n=1 Tax=Xanthomonas vesicatoria TaxID=56460 RepID=UPI002B4B9FC8|nr:asparagine synthase C-terminal domain-containing protein [Xanthomonas vesicatoria]